MSGYKQGAEKLAVIVLLVSLCIGCWSLLCPGCAVADPLTPEAGAPGEEAGADLPYHTPLAGESGRATLLGHPVEIPALDRGNMTSITLGVGLLSPRQGDTQVLPFVALYLRRVGEEFRTRDVISLFVNDLEYDRRFGNFELVGLFENNTIPGGRAELVRGREIDSTTVLWGTLLGSLGPGLRIPVAPYEVDNDLRIQLLGRAGYFYAARTDETGADQLLPPDTLLYGAKLRVRYDSMRRNLLELSHSGFAAGFDLDYLSRDRWGDLGAPGTALSSGNREYLQVNGYFVGAGGIPGLSERNRLMLSLHGGTIADNKGDRYNAFRINGGPFPSEEADVSRQHYTGLVFDDILATKYATASWGYRRELTFFAYLSLIGSYIWADRATVSDTGQVVIRNTTGLAYTAALDCAFFWKSSFYLAYAWDSGVIRGGRSGGGALLTWNKLF